MKLALKIVGGLFAGVIGLMAVGVLTLAALFKLSVPDLDGTITVAGLNAPATISRDAYGIASIQADSELDAAFATGYAHAQERLFQMEFMRRSGSGTLAEVIGRPGVGIDTFMRVLGIRRLAEQTAEELPPQILAVFEAYADGVNAYLADPGGLLPPEFQFMPDPAPWTPADSLIFPRLMALQLSGNWFEELLRAAVLGHLPASKANQLWPQDEGDAPYTLDVAELDLPQDSLTALLDGMSAALKPTLASNIWALSGENTDTGKPLLATDPHLGLQAPALWYLAEISYPGGYFAGATVPGVPMGIIGHNGRVAWGFTTTHSDTADLFIERVYDDGTYETPDGPQPLVTREETINVRFGDAVTITVRESRHGPLVSDHTGPFGDRSAQDIAGDGQALALSFAALKPGDRTVVAQYNSLKAQTGAGFHEAMRDFHAPQQNVVYADVDGTIGFIAPARVPIRAAGNGLTPVPGWDDGHAWLGWVPFEELPQVVNPPPGRIMNANNRITGPDYPHLIAAKWPAPYRAIRLEEVLSQERLFSAQDMIDLQMDSTSAAAQEILPLLLELVDTQDQKSREAVAILSGWDGLMDRDGAEPLIFNAWMDQLSGVLFADELGDDLKGRFRSFDPRVIARVIRNEEPWCQSPDIASCAQAVTLALGRALSALDEIAGPDMTKWRWGDFHFAGLDHQIFGFVPVLRGLANRNPPMSGDNYTVNRGGHAALDSRTPFKHRHGAGLRAVFDLSDLSQSQFIIAPGQAGHLLADTYGVFADMWANGETVTIGGRATAVQTTLTPR